MCRFRWRNHKILNKTITFDIRMKSGKRIDFYGELLLLIKIILCQKKQIIAIKNVTYCERGMSFVYLCGWYFMRILESKQNKKKHSFYVFHRTQQYCVPNILRWFFHCGAGGEVILTPLNYLILNATFLEDWDIVIDFGAMLLSNTLRYPDNVTTLLFF